MRKTIAKCLFATALIIGTNGAMAQSLNMGTLPQGSVAYAVGAAISSTLGDHGLTTRVVPQGGPVVVLPQLDREAFDLTVTPSIPMAYGYHGNGMFAERGKLDNLRALAVLFPLEVAFLVRQDSGITSLEDLRGKRVAGGFPRQEALLKMMEASLATAGLTLDDVTQVPVPDGGRGLDELASGNVDAAIFSVGSGKVAQTDASVSGGVRFLPIETSEEGITAMQGIAPTSYVGTAEPGQSRPGIEKPIPVLASSMLLAGHASLDNESVAQVLRVILDEHEKIAQVHGAFREFSPEEIYRELGVPYHSAALEFFRAQGLAE